MPDRYRFTIRWDVNNPTKQPRLADPGGSYNLQSLATFGRFGALGEAASPISAQRGCTM